VASREEQFKRVQLLYQCGNFEVSQKLASNLAERYRIDNPRLAARYRNLEAQSVAWRGLNEEVLNVLLTDLSFEDNADIQIRRLSLRGLAHAHLHQFDEANLELAQGEALCYQQDQQACAELFGSRGGAALEQGKYEEAVNFFLRSLTLARRFNLSFDESVALMNIGVVCLMEERFDEAIDWIRASNRLAEELGAQDILLNNTGNLGWALYKLGDSNGALNLFQDAERRAIAIGDTDGTIAWLTTSGFVFQDFHDLPRALSSFKQALDLARNIKSSEKLVNSMEDIAHASIDAGELNQAQSYLAQLRILTKSSGNRLDELDILLAQGRIAAARREDKQAETIFATVIHDPASQTSMRLGAGHELARLYEAEGNPSAAERTYKATLTTFEAARDQLKKEDSKLPFLANATRIYDDYISFLVSHGKVEEALAAADSSRARTLAQGLGIKTESKDRESAFQELTVHPSAIARSTAATLLFYWLGEKQSYLWAISPARTALYTLPAQREIASRIENYRKALLGISDPIEAGNEDGRALYRMLVAPAAAMIRPGTKVIVLADGELSKLNFETLIAPSPQPHYWIEDATLLSAPSLRMMASAHPAQAGDKLLMLGNAVSPGPDYPDLPMAATEMKLIEAHFPSTDAAVFSRAQANAQTYLASKPERFGYIHFVTHASASSTDPLDSAIILSRSASTEQGFKLYARQILTRPIHARLVTISACYGNGTRSYAGEGLVGLSWAFLHAGAHNVIGALWEVSDDSTPRLMDALYQGLQDGQPPAAALRHAKLLLLHTKGNFRKPFFWAPFQIYSGL
jgi:CHAT domain-containing protein